MEPPNKDVEVGKAIYQDMKVSGRWMMSYQDFVREWQAHVDQHREPTKLYEALLLAIHGYGEAGGVMSFLSVPWDEDAKEPLQG